VPYYLFKHLKLEDDDSTHTNMVFTRFKGRERVEIKCVMSLVPIGRSKIFAIAFFAVDVHIYYTPSVSIYKPYSFLRKILEYKVYCVPYLYGQIFWRFD
jgi:hypothetical protein